MNPLEWKKKYVVGGWGSINPDVEGPAIFDLLENYISEKKIINIFDEQTLYHGGLSVRTSLDTRTQSLADSALKNGLKNYDKRHGYKGPLNKFKNINMNVDNNKCQRYKQFNQHLNIFLNL